MANLFGNLFGKEEDEVMEAPEVTGAVEQPLPVGIENPMVREYMMNRKSLVDKQREEAAGPDYSGAALSILDGITGRSDADEFSKERKEKKANELKQLDESFNTFNQANKADFELQKMGKDKELFARESDPMSAESKLAQDLAIRMGVSPDMASKITAEQWKAQGPMYQKMFEVERSKEDRALARQDRAIERSERNQDREFLQNEKKEEKLAQLQTPFGLANTAQDAKDLKEGFESKRSFDSKIDEMIALRKKFGGEVANREAVARGKQLSKDLLLEYKNMAKLGVLSAADEAIINAIIPDDPLAFSPSSLVGQDPILSNLQKFRQDSENNFKTKVATRTRAGLQDFASGKASTQPELPPEEASAARQKRIAELKAKKAGTYVSK